MAAVPHIDFVLNGRPVRVEAPSTGLTLLDFVRERGLTGAKEGCAEGECGACAVIVVAPEGAGSAYRVANSCLLSLPQAAGHEVYTVEGLAGTGELTAAQEAMAAAGGSQCGYCTPGFVMSLFAEQYRPGRVGPCDPMAMGGNLCRCTGYRPIRDAALSLGPAPPGPWLERLSQPAPRLEAVRLPEFSRPTTLDECLALMATQPDAAIVAGGSDLGVESNLKGTRWSHVISLEGIGELRELTEDGVSVRIGAALPLADLERLWTDAPAVFAGWFALFASPSIRNRATLGGNLATASPIGDSAPLLLALDADIHVAGRDGRRAIPIASFFTGYRRTALERGEIVTAVELRQPYAKHLRFYKVAKRRLDDISTVAAAMAVDRDVDGRVRRARFAFGGVAATPVRIIEAEEAAAGQPWTAATVERVQRALERTLAPISDARGSADYRRQVACSLVEKFFEESRT
ncbi:MAG TPA: FAD binding domain-containing protein [Vicinamibacterales bacterium]|jgi:xanthine dehydrogenase small subunit|nr:FAD binding domain-containing protein [Vicinamibacterales bacterium]